MPINRYDFWREPWRLPPRAAPRVCGARMPDERSGLPSHGGRSGHVWLPRGGGAQPARGAVLLLRGVPLPF